MKGTALALSALFVIATAGPAHAQFGSILKGANKAADAKQKLDDLTFSEQEERQIGEQVSLKLRNRFGVFQNEAVTKYVSLVGGALAQTSTRPALDWKFIVLDTDGVNAYAAPGGFVHITRGLLGLLKNESELAGVLGHEITHVTEKHTIGAIQQDKTISIGADVAGSKGLTASLIAKYAERAFGDIFDGKFSQKDESQSDKIGVQMANKLGYAPLGLAQALLKVADRNASRTEPNGFFKSHPAIKDRIANIEKQIKSEKLAGKAIVEARYKQHITFDAKPMSEIATDVEGAAGLASGDKKKADDKKADEKAPAEPQKKGGLGSALGSVTGQKQAQSGQQASSAGARGVGPDRDAKGGSNPNALKVTITAAELEAFKKGIVA
jgi:beta-barrel assembly-enhancing protease